MLAVGSEHTVLLAQDDWQARQAAHEHRVDRWITPHLRRRRRGQAHPVLDFLFDYYSYRPAQLRRWHPGPDAVLGGVAADGFLRYPEYHWVDAGVAISPAALGPRRAETADWIRRLLVSTAARPGQYGCFGMHEWAMVYRAEPGEVRHTAQPLRFGADRIASVVDGQQLRCTHFDAYRFFTPPARPRNLIEPTRADQHALEQPGCLHANMDLYKWAYKLAPFVASELVADSFELAREIRVLDMRASPYDLESLGYSPIRVETGPGRAEYVRAQREFAVRAAQLRDRLVATIDRLLTAHEGVPAD